MHFGHFGVRRYDEWLIYRSKTVSYLGYWVPYILETIGIYVYDLMVTKLRDGSDIKITARHIPIRSSGCIHA
jgi:hypothetical protein